MRSIAATTTLACCLASTALAQVAAPVTTPVQMNVNLGSSSFQAADTVDAGVVGSGVNGPAHAKVGLSVNLTKNNWWQAIGPTVGEVDGVYSSIWQGGAGSDTSAYLGQITATGLGFANIMEGTISIQPPISSGNGSVVDQVDVQMGMVNGLSADYGFNANHGIKAKSVLSTGYSLNGSGWDYAANWFNGSLQVFRVDGAGNLYAPYLSGAGDAITVNVNGKPTPLSTLLATPGNPVTPTPVPAPTSPTPASPSNSFPAATGDDALILPDPLGGQTALGWHGNTHELSVRNSAPNANTLAVENDSDSGFAAATFRGLDLAYQVGTAFEHMAVGWAPRCNLRGGLGCDYIEASRYDGTQNPHMMAPPFEILQTGGEFTAPPVPVVVAITAGSTKATVVQGTLPTSANDGQNLTSVEYPNYLAEGATITAVQGATLTLSKPSVMTNGWVPAEYGPTAYGQYNWFEATETGSVNIYRFVDSLGGGMHDPFMAWDRIAGTVRIAATPVVPQTGGYTLGKPDCGTVIRDTGVAAHAYAVAAGLPVGCRVSLIQEGGTIGFTTAGVSIEEQAGTAHVTTGLHAEADLLIDSPTTVLLRGDVR